MPYVGSYVGAYVGVYLGSLGPSAVVSAPDEVLVTYPIVPVGQADHLREAIARLPEQFKSKPNIVRLLFALVSPAYDLEAALWALLTERTIDAAIGAQLDALGELVGQGRGGLSDADYRRYIRARVMTNRSRGTLEDLVRVVNLVINDDTTDVLVLSQNGTAVVQLVGVATTDSLASIVISFLRDAKSGGVQIILESSPAADSDMFFTGQTVFVLGARGGGETTASVYAPNGETAAWFATFPATGSLIFDEGVPGIAETVAYTSKVIQAGPAYVFNLATPLAHAHNTGAAITLASGPGRGLGDSTEGGQPSVTPYAPAGTTGGQMADART